MKAVLTKLCVYGRSLLIQRLLILLLAPCGVLLPMLAPGPHGRVPGHPPPLWSFLLVMSVAGKHALGAAHGPPSLAAPHSIPREMWAQLLSLPPAGDIWGELLFLVKHHCCRCWCICVLEFSSLDAMNGPGEEQRTHIAAGFAGRCWLYRHPSPRYCDQHKC